MSYEEAWGDILCHHTQFRCRVCPDSTGEWADISCGDPWYREIEPGDPGRSLVLVRTPRGRAILRGAMESGFVLLEPADPETLPKSQISLLGRRRALWGRLAAFRVCRVPTPRYRGFSLFANWRRLSLRERLRSLFGTFYRIIQRHWNRPLRDD
jgi:coenzyme F420 hydrogenase subunit beta